MENTEKVFVDTVRSALARHLQLTALNIKVETKGDIVLLSGSVDLLLEKISAEEIVRSLAGVRMVKNELVITEVERIDDKELETLVNAQLLDGGKRLSATTVKTKDGVVYLAGGVETLADEDLACRLAAKVRGVKDVVSRLQTISIGGQPNDETITAGVEAALAQSPLLRGEDIGIRASDGVVQLTGLVETIKKRDIAIQLAAGVAGARKVVSKLLLGEEQSETDIYLTEIYGQVLADSIVSGLQGIRAVVVDGWVYLSGEVATVDHVELAEQLIDQINTSVGTAIEGMSSDILVRVH